MRSQETKLVHWDQHWQATLITCWFPFCHADMLGTGRKHKDCEIDQRNQKILWGMWAVTSEQIGGAAAPVICSADLCLQTNASTLSSPPLAWSSTISVGTASLRGHWLCGTSQAGFHSLIQRIVARVKTDKDFHVLKVHLLLFLVFCAIGCQ